MKRTMAFAFLLIAWAVPAGANTLHPPASILDTLPQLQPVAKVTDLPAVVRAGTFILPSGKMGIGWTLAEPGAAFNATDTPVDPSLPGRRLILAACDASTCLLHYERGGVAHIFFLMTLVRSGATWKATWIAEGGQRLADLSAVKVVLENRSENNYLDENPDALGY